MHHGMHVYTNTQRQVKAYIRTHVYTVTEAESLGIPAYALAKYDPLSKNRDPEYEPGIEEYREAIVMVQNVIGMYMNIILRFIQTGHGC
jgi:hypothetical protein